VATSRGLRALVAESWFRSAAAGVRADTVHAPITLPDDTLRDHREAHPLARVFPLLEDVLGQAAKDCDAIMAVSDEAGQLLWLCGSPASLRRAEPIGFVEGSNWDETLAGTNAPGMALRLDESVQVIRAEHFRTSVQRWSCAATPIHDPNTQALLGVLDITGGAAIEVPQTMGMVRAAARMAEAELARDSLQRRTSPEPAAHPADIAVSVESLGRSESLLTVSTGSRTPVTIRLSPRHSEIVVLLACAPRGLSGDELAVLLYEQDTSDSTLRAELKRLRGLLGDELLASRPYRLVAEISADWLAVQARLSAGDVAGALLAYRGPLLPQSTAPGVGRLRAELENELRQAVLTSRQSNLMSTWTRSAWGTDDYGMWRAQYEQLPTASPLRPLAAAQLRRLDRELGVDQPTLRRR
jgi:hypothetical protein